MNVPKNVNANKSFYFIGFEYAVQDGCRNYYPCEVGLVKYSLEWGVEKILHYFLNPGDLPIGTKGAAKKHSEERHKIPYLGFDRATADYVTVTANIRQFIQNGSRSSILYCMPNDVNMVRSCLRFLIGKVRGPFSENIPVVDSVTTLVQQVCCQDGEFCDESVAFEIANSSHFDYLPGVVCDWHYDTDCIFCALGTARKMAFNISNALANMDLLKLTSNHLPPSGSSLPVSVSALGRGRGPISSLSPTNSMEIPRLIGGMGRGRGILFAANKNQ